ncbi:MULTISPECIES: HAD family hydrolase [Turicibacter]|jgi:Cof subfamily protein (haloacid dehalogenase superfamily)|uniref:Cof-type HAD-IIB family hydrolase n=2 Tax=Turicibacter sanguinis TaxID=154288 RepID=A0A9X4XDP5_9FIRM|nr:MULTISPECIES: HAD family hydrolase [Turicibacter]EFF65153.1 Cof-like hydrolase [Turicibacter sanguinis PC909]EGC90805.1 Cof-like hydrolase [Turicibacter sp. HGF1]MBP3903401.1 Cof-type HAD-IIB family hydrolase [Turicibacter sp.]MCU7190576.1 Cof-type HAD-IIB family hydrolase [Turicibacter sanguinis]MCU7196908.1 Cof-type HAD-IIB family hydrolase [Turicibacter sanguinis]
MIKFIATDMDGTLLNSQNEIHPSFYETFKKLKEKDIIFAIASGRQYYNLAKRFEELKDDLMFIAENGTFVMYKGEEVLINALDKQVAKELIEVGRQIDNAYIIVCGKKAAYIENTDERFVEQVQKYYESRQVVKSFDEVDDDILKVTICDFSGSEKNAYPYYKDYYETQQVSVSGEIWLDITAKGANKGYAIEHVKKLFKLEHEQTAAFGDYLNDLEMMQSVYHSFAMANAHEQLKQVSRFMAKSNDENGVVEKIEELLSMME